jgi:transposase
MVWNGPSGRHRKVPKVVLFITPGEGPFHGENYHSRVGLGQVRVQVHAVDGAGEVLVRRALRRAWVLEFFRKLAPCIVGMEACGSAHYWGPEIAALGHTVRIMPPAYVKPYVKRNKTDAADAAGICEGVTRLMMRFVPIKSAAQQGAGMVLKTRDLLIRQRTQSANALRGHMAELGIVGAMGMRASTSSS